MKVNPIYKKEVKVSSRSMRLSMILMVFNGVLAAAALLNMYSVLYRVWTTAEIQYSGFLEMYVFVAAVEFAMLLFIMPAVAAGSISGERERQTFNILLSTQTTPGHHTGKDDGFPKQYVFNLDCQFPGDCSGICLWRNYLEGFAAAVFPFYHNGPSGSRNWPVLLGFV